MSDHSSVPRWPAEAPPFDDSGQTFGIVADADCPVAREWMCAIQATGRPCWWVDREYLDRILDLATVGLRVMVSGPELDVLAVAAHLKARGLADAELTLHATSSDQRRIYCVHCSAMSLTNADVESVTPCGSCGRMLSVFGHVSRRTGSYLGFQHDAEALL